MKTEFNLGTEVQFLKTVGPARSRALARLGIATVGDLIRHYPRRYFDRSGTHNIGNLRAGQHVTVQGEVLTCGERRTRRGGKIQTVALGDDTGVLFCVWFSQSYILKQFQPGRRVMASGQVQFRQGKAQLAHPDFEVLEAEAAETETTPLHTGRLVPVYGLTAGIGQHWLRALVFQALERLGAFPETLPHTLVKKRHFMGGCQALRAIHFPGSQADLDAARQRLVYEEIFLIQVLMALRRQSRFDRPGIQLAKPGDLTKRLVEDLPFALTGAQRRVLAEILVDLRSGRIMHRMLQGDVGSGKTLVALIAALFVIEQGHQAVIMAPTEVLARQHGQTIARLIEPLQITSETLTGSTKSAERRAILAGVAAGEIDLLVGTHAVIQDDVRLPNLGLAVVDEQHRFGVKQRARSTAAGDDADNVHVLVMSATPIPRSLSMTLYGDLELSLIDELPGGRQPITTHIAQEKDEVAVWQACHTALAAEQQVYVIYPVIEETEGQDLKAATVEYEDLRGRIFPDHRVALIHGRLKAQEKQEIMAAFSSGQIQVLVATTVIEVGVDVPNATTMVIHNPERFGLAQLHQLRGRIGRGTAASSCWLLCDRFLAEASYERIRFFAGQSDGFVLAEEDLRQRGPGDVWGVRQHGMPGFRLANPLRDVETVRMCRDDARDLLESDPKLTGADGQAVARTLASGFGSGMPILTG